MTILLAKDVRDIVYEIKMNFGPSEDELFAGLDGVGEWTMMSKCKETIPGENHFDCLH